MWRGWSALVAVALLAAAPARAATSEYVMDAATGRTLHADNADRARPPASLTKLMVLLLAFEALDAGRMKPGSPVVMTAGGERQQPSRLGLRRGRSITVDVAMRAVAVISANDIAVALGTKIAGSERAFIRRMNERAEALGMEATRFDNMTGLSPSSGRSSAHDMAILSRYILRNHPARYRLFATRSIRWGGAVRPNHNKLLGKVKGVDGLKTGYTVAAGFNLAASARRAGRRVIVVVMGAATPGERDVRVANLIELGFTSLATRRR
jgi:D-alanyl-D-alanine carboxypeptidase